jgi:hypothetical protein
MSAFLLPLRFACPQAKKGFKGLCFWLLAPAIPCAGGYGVHSHKLQPRNFLLSEILSIAVEKAIPNADGRYSKAKFIDRFR